MFQELYSPNHSIHIGNLKKALAEARDELEKVKFNLERLQSTLQRPFTASELSVEVNRSLLLEAELEQVKRERDYAVDAANKGDLARQNAGGMELQIEELQHQLSASEASRKELMEALKLRSRTLEKEIELLLLRSKEDPNAANTIRPFGSALHRHKVAIDKALANAEALKGETK